MYTPRRPFGQGKHEKKIFFFFGEPLIGVLVQQMVLLQCQLVPVETTKGCRLFKEGEIGRSIGDDPNCT